MGLLWKVLLPLLVVANAPAFADDAFHLSGFGTLGYVYDNRSDIAAVRDIVQKPKNSFATGSNWLVDSRLGVQLEYNISPIADFVGQVVLRDQFQNNFNSSTELAYFAIRPQPNLDVRVGRVNYDAFLMADYRNVGYAYTWVRPPTEFYGWVPIFSVNGLDAAYNIYSDAARWRIKAQAGGSKSSLPIGGGYDFSTHNLLGVSVSRQSDFLRLKAAYSQFTVDSEVPAFALLFAGLDAVSAAAIPSVSAEAADLRNNLSFNNAAITYTTLGAAYDDGVWITQAELGYATSTANVIPHGSMAYLSVGHRFGDWTPFMLLSAFRPGNDVRNAANNWGSYNATLRDPALYTLNTTRIDQHTLSFGTRWDFHRKAALKLQLDSTVINPSGYGLWWRDLNLNNQTTRVNLISSTLDFVF